MNLHDQHPEISGEYVRIVLEGLVILFFMVMVAAWAGLGAGA